MPAMNSRPAPATAMITAVPRSGWYPMRKDRERR